MGLAVTLMLPEETEELAREGQGLAPQHTPPSWVLAAASWRLETLLYKCLGVPPRPAQSRDRLENRQDSGVWVWESVRSLLCLFQG